MKAIEFPTTLQVTDQEIDISFLTPTQKEFYVHLFNDLIKLYSSKQKSRVVVGLAGPTGSGKSVIAALCEEFSKQQKLHFEFNTLGIDAFSYPNEFLESHTDSTGKSLKEVKGRFDTYDVSKLVTTLRNFKEGEMVSLPTYSRVIHDPIEDAQSVSKDNSLLLIEGLWLLSDEGEWSEVRPLLDYSIFVDADKVAVRNMVLQRHERGGRSSSEAAAYYDTVDTTNFDLVMRTKGAADRIIPSYYDVK